MSAGCVAVAVSMAGLTAWLSGFLVRPLLALARVTDVPNHRSSHDRPVIRGGGVTILLVLAVAAVPGVLPPECSSGGRTNWMVVTAVAMVAGVSFVDDVRTLPSWIRMLVHGLAAGMAVSELGPMGEWAGGDLAWGWRVVIWCGIVGYANAFNFMDGVNGLAAIQAAIACAFGVAFCFTSNGADSSGGLVLLQAVLLGATLGFLPHNFPVARMFLGDVGSVTIGFVLALIVVGVWNVSGWRAGLALGVMHANFVLDTAITLSRRLWKGDRIHEAHREHFYQRLSRSGKSHVFVSCSQLAIQVCGGLILSISLQAAVEAFAIAVSLVVAGWLMYFYACEQRFRAIERTG